MKQVVSFDRIKLTNNQLDDNGHVSLSLRLIKKRYSLRHSLLLFLDYFKLNAQVSASISCTLHASAQRGLFDDAKF